MTQFLHLRDSSYRYLLFALCFLGGVFGGVSSTLMAAYLPVVIKDLTDMEAQTDSSHIGAIINASYLFGMMFGGIGLGFFSDRFGRKKAVSLAIAFLGMFMLCTAFAQSWQMLAGLRFLTGFGTGGVLLTSAVLVAEAWTERNRTVALGILSITIPVGIFSAGIITYNIESWRSGFLIGIAPLTIAMLAYIVLEESEKWKQDRLAFKSDSAPSLPPDPALATSTSHSLVQLSSPARLLAYSPAQATSIFHPSVRRDLLLGSIIYGSMLIGLWAVFMWLPTWVQTLVQGSDGQKERGLSMILFAMGGLTGGFISGWVSRHFGVKRTLLVCFAATFTLTFLLFKTNATLTFLSFVEMGLIALFFGMSQGVLNGYVPELFPTAVRSAATGFCFNVGRVFTASVVFFVGWLEAVLGGYGNALFGFSFVFLIGLIASFFAKERQLISA